MHILPFPRSPSKQVHSSLEKFIRSHCQPEACQPQMQLNRQNIGQQYIAAPSADSGRYKGCFNISVGIECIFGNVVYRPKQLYGKIHRHNGAACPDNSRIGSEDSQKLSVKQEYQQRDCYVAAHGDQQILPIQLPDAVSAIFLCLHIYYIQPLTILATLAK